MRVHYVLEDLAHARFVPPMFGRIANDEGLVLEQGEGLPEGGAGRAISALRQVLADIRDGTVDQPDLIVVSIDADCGQQGNRARQVERACERERYPGSVLIAEPDPHIEIWYLADPQWVQQLLQTAERPTIPTVRCKKDEYKERLRSAVLSSGAPAPLGGIEYGPEIAQGMDLYRASRNVSSLARFVDAARDQCAIFRNTLG